MIVLQFLVVLLFVFIGARLGGIAIGLAGGAGVIVLGLLGLQVDPKTGVPWDVLGIIICVIAAIAAMQAAGGLELLVYRTERLLRSRPSNITFMAPVVTYFMTVLSGTGQIAFSTLPVIAEVSKEAKIRPSRPLSIAVVASQMAIVASPISAATVAMAAVLEPMGVDFIKMLTISGICTLTGCMIAAFVASRLGCELEDDPIYQDRLARGLVSQSDPAARENFTPRKGAALSLIIFAVTLVVVVLYSTAISESVGLISDPTIDRSAAIMTFMMLAALLIVVFCKVEPPAVIETPTFRAGMNAAVCITGVAWLGNTFVQNHVEDIERIGGDVIHDHPWMLAIVLLLASALLYSQAATTIALMPVAAGMGVSASALLASFPAVTGLFLLPTYTTVVAAIELDDTGTTRIGKYLFNHSFMIPGLVAVASSIALGFVIAPVLI
ncbi:anaerobic C4-dicarboxylate transporter DcuA [Branchiibius hedensis]|uniref:C4-dicarboxylate transporter DcuA n=1 Tax=Branchiibius hedensis TaxID=672460 RepID=A0A2Y9C184_9MICO|nr:anaerobic C4-dicarboxylate transporter [Branchiibius hedensis]PWJ25098.1 anaerobic C4-dicarboxylate transporter DcuA [Branchiibius hedensis]SSA33913.1 anaerobic C4-dicarboxylate transporter DcuA [Branchiibius hedensis]